MHVHRLTYFVHHQLEPDFRPADRLPKTMKKKKGIHSRQIYVRRMCGRVWESVCVSSRYRGGERERESITDMR